MVESGDTFKGGSPEVLLFPSGSSIKVSLPDPQHNSPCEMTKGLHQYIKHKFLDIIKLWFKPIPAYPDYYYYSPEQDMVGSLQFYYLSEIKNL